VCWCVCVGGRVYMFVEGELKLWNEIQEGVGRERRGVNVCVC